MQEIFSRKYSDRRGRNPVEVPQLRQVLQRRGPVAWHSVQLLEQIVLLLWTDAALALDDAAHRRVELSPTRGASPVRCELKRVAPTKPSATCRPRHPRGHLVSALIVIFTGVAFARLSLTGQRASTSLLSRAICSGLAGLWMRMVASSD